MQNIKNSLKKLRTNRAFREAVMSQDLPPGPDVDMETKRQRYREAIPDTVTYKGYEFPADAVHRRVLEEIEDLDVFDEDIFLVSYPANGGHLLEDIVQMMVAKHLSKKAVAEAAAAAEAEKGTQDPLNGNNEVPNGEKEQEKEEEEDKMPPVPVARLEAANIFGHIRWLKSLRPPRIISTSLPYDLLPKQIHSPTGSKLVYLARNSKDHIVAYYYHHRLKGISLSLEDFVDLYLNGDLLYGNYFDHVLSYWQWSQLYPDNVMFLCYEELKIVTITMAELMAKFFHLNLTEKEIEQILTEKHTGSNAIDGEDLRNASANGRGVDRAQARRLNKFHNVLGDWNHYLDGGQCKRIDSVIRTRFHSQRLYLAESAEEALKRIEKYGRILATEVQTEKSSSPSQPAPLANLVGNLMNNNSNNNNYKENNDDKDSGSRSRFWPNRKSKPFRKKLVLTKDEARFIRNKDKVIIICDDDDNGGDGRTDARNDKVWHFFWNLCCCWCCFGRRQQYNKI